MSNKKSPLFHPAVAHAGNFQGLVIIDVYLSQQDRASKRKHFYYNVNETDLGGSII